MQIVAMGRKKFSADFQLMFRLLKFMLFVGLIVIVVLLFIFLKMTANDLLVCVLAFYPTGWAILQVHMHAYISFTS